MLLSLVKSDFRLSDCSSVFIKKFENYEIIFTSGPNVCNMRNNGAKAASGEWILFCDYDCEIKIEHVINFIKKNNNTKILAVGGVYKAIKHNRINRAYNLLQRLWVLKGIYTKKRGLKLGENFFGGCLLINKKTFIGSDGFNETIGWGGEELEFHKKLQKSGIPILISYRLRPSHHTNLNLKDFFYRAWVQNKNKVKYKLDTNAINKNTGFDKFVFKRINPLILGFGVVALISRFFCKINKVRSLI